MRAVVVQKTCPHYRKPFFEALTRSRTVQFSVAFGSARPWDSLQGTEPGKIRHIPLDNVWLARTGDWVWQAGALRLAWDRTIDVLILDSDPRILSNLLLCLLGRLLRKKILLWGHGIGSRRTWFVRTLKAYLPRLLNGYLFYDSIRAREMISWGLPERYAFVATNSLDTRTIRRLSRDWDDEVRSNVLYIGRLIPEKRVELLLLGFARAVAGLPPDVSLTLVGDGPERDRLTKRAGELGIGDRVRFAGEVTQETGLAPFFNTSWVSVSPGHIGLSAVHSLAYGLPLLVAEGEPHGPEIIAFEPGRNGRSFRNNDPDDLAAALREMWRDQAGLAAMSACGKLKIEQEFSVQSMVASFEQAVEAVTAR